MESGLFAVTGARGFTGRHVCQELRLQGYRVHEIESDIMEADALKQELMLVAPNYCLHLAGVAYTQHKGFQGLYDSNLVGSINLLEALQLVSVESVLLASSGMLYAQTEDAKLNEYSLVSPVNHYSNSKLAMEYAAGLYRSSLPIIIARPFNYTGIYQSNKFVIPKIVEHFKDGSASLSVGNTEVYREFNDVRDVAKIYIALMTKVRSHGTPINICTGHGVGISDVIKICKDITDHEIEVSVDSRFVREGEPKRVVGDPALLRSLIGYKPKFNIEMTLEWMLDAQ